jgi:hypothetical protein
MGICDGISIHATLSHARKWLRRGIHYLRPALSVECFVCLAHVLHALLPGDVVDCQTGHVLVIIRDREMGLHTLCGAHNHSKDREESHFADVKI